MPFNSRISLPSAPAIQDAAKAVLLKIGRFELAYELYEALLRDADSDIANTKTARSCLLPSRCCSVAVLFATADAMKELMNEQAGTD